MNESDFSIHEIRTDERTSTKDRRTLKKAEKVVPRPSKCLICVTVCLFVIIIIMGYGSTLPGLLWHHWTQELGIDEEFYSRLWMLEGAGIFTGSLFCVVFPCNAMGFGLGSILMTCFPILFNKIFFLISSLVSGIGKGMLCVCSLKLLYLWPETSASLVIQLFFIAYHIGGLVCTQTYQHYDNSKYTIPFLKNCNATSFDVAFNSSNEGPYNACEIHTFQAAFVLLSVLIFIFVSFWTCCCKNDCCTCCSPKNKPSVMAYEDFKNLKSSVNLSMKSGEQWVSSKEELDVDKNVKKINLRKWFTDNYILDISVLMFLFIHFFFAFGMENLLFKYFCRLNTVLSSEKLTYALDTYLTYTIMSCMFILGRFFSISFSKTSSSNAIVATCLATCVLSSTIISAYFNKSEPLIIFCIASLCAFTSPLLPAGLSWANLFLANSYKALGLSFCLAGLGSAVFSWIGGFILQRLDPLYLSFFITAFFCLAALMYVPLLVRIKKPENKRIVTYV